MAESTQYSFKHQELAQILVKQQGLHEGLWQVFYKFAIRAANVGGSALEDLLPTAIIPIVEVGIMKVDELNNLSVDASVVNPRPRKLAKAQAKPVARRRPVKRKS